MVDNCGTFILLAMDGMDRKIEKKNKFFSKRTLWISILSVIILLVAYNLVFGDKSSKLNVEIEKISIAEIKKDVFQDYISFCKYKNQTV